MPPLADNLYRSMVVSVYSTLFIFANNITDAQPVISRMDRLTFAISVFAFIEKYGMEKMINSAANFTLFKITLAQRDW